MKGTPQFPQCGFSGRVVQILDYLGAPVVGVNVLEDAEIRQGIKEFANWPTIPQLYIKGEFIGGADIATEMFQSGELAALLTDAGVDGEAGRQGLTRLQTNFRGDPAKAAGRFSRNRPHALAKIRRGAQRPLKFALQLELLRLGCSSRRRRSRA